MKESSEKSKKGCGCLILVCITLCFLVFLLVSYFRWFAPIMVEESFEGGDTGWLVVGDAQGESDKPTYEVDGGNPGAHMSAVDDAVGGVWFWSAPDSFLKQLVSEWEKKGSLRAVLTFDLKQSDLSNPFEDKDVILGSGDQEVYFKHAKPPGTEWTSFRVPLRPSAGWVSSSTGEPATKDEMSIVISQLDKLWIRGEFRTGDDTGGIDNISIR